MQSLHTLPLWSWWLYYIAVLPTGFCNSIGMGTPFHSATFYVSAAIYAEKWELEFRCSIVGDIIFQVYILLKYHFTFSSLFFQSHPHPLYEWKWNVLLRVGVFTHAWQYSDVFFGLSEIFRLWFSAMIHNNNNNKWIWMVFTKYGTRPPTGI